MDLWLMLGLSRVLVDVLLLLLTKGSVSILRSFRLRIFSCVEDSFGPRMEWIDMDVLVVGR